MDKVRVILISSVRPGPTSAGQIVLHRHLVDQPGIELEVYGCEPPGFSLSAVIRRLVGKIGQTSLRNCAEDFWVFWQGRWMDAVLPAVVAEPERTVVVTVAHGDGFMAARRFARRYGLPLVSIFHDWWPDIAEVHSFAKRQLEREFRGLAEVSAATICVSEGMKRELGRKCCVVVLPMPAVKQIQEHHKKVNGKLRVLYSGNLAEYGPMLGEALKALESNERVELIVRGARPDWPADVTEKMRKQGKWLEFAPRAELESWLESADAFLVPMLFDAKMRRRMVTSFPSKLIEFAQFGKPLVVWGPEYCSAIEWGGHDNRALCVTDPTPAAVVAALDQLAASPEMRQRLSEAASEAACGEFSPDGIQRSFRAILDDLLIVKSSCSDSSLRPGNLGET